VTRVIVTGAEHQGGLAAIRALRAAGFEPWAATPKAYAYGALSRASEGTIRVPDPRREPGEFASVLAERSVALGAAVLLPGSEADLLALSEHRDLFTGDIAAGLPEKAGVVAATDKVDLARRALAAGFDSPPSVVLHADEAIPDEMPGWRDAVVKPVRSELAGDAGMRRFEAVRVRGQAELQAALAALPGHRGLVQPFLRGRLRTVNGVSWRGDVVATVHKVAERTWPVDCGVVCYARTVAVEPHVDRAARRLIADLGWSGLFNLQMIDVAGGQYLIDLNPRLYHSLALATRAGLNLPAMWVALLLGRRPASTAYRTGVRFRSEEDVRALLAVARGGRPVRALRGLVPRPRTAHAVVSVADPVPTLAVLRRAAALGRSVG
jgi:predicted ATP-grasp superfamily ATP-dependent carboligase